MNLTEPGQKPLFAAMPGNEKMAEDLAISLDGDFTAISVHRFPDEEVLTRFDVPLAGRPIFIVCTLDRPDAKVLPLLFAAETALDCGASYVALIAPYLSYMRQDKSFHKGEAVTSKIFAAHLSDAFDFLVTVDPHLHRYKQLTDVYALAAEIVHADHLMASWVRVNVQDPVFIGPDEESRQWLQGLAASLDAPVLILEKTRLGDRTVKISAPGLERFNSHTPVLVDDIISTGRTMVEAIRHLRNAGMAPPICMGVHGVFAGDAYHELMNAGAARVVTSNTIAHPSNVLDITEGLAEAVRQFLPV